MTRDAADGIRIRRLGRGDPRVMSAAFAAGRRPRAPPGQASETREGVTIPRAAPAADPTRAARQAGSQQATADTTTSSATTPAYVTASRRETPKSSVTSRRLATSAAPSPIPMPTEVQPRHPLPHHQAEDARPRRAERAAHADLAPALGDAAGEHAVDAGRREHQRRDRERLEQDQREAPLGRRRRDHRRPSSRRARSADPCRPTRSPAGWPARAPPRRRARGPRATARCPRTATAPSVM